MGGGGRNIQSDISLSLWMMSAVIPKCTVENVLRERRVFCPHQFVDECVFVINERSSSRKNIFSLVVYTRCQDGVSPYSDTVFMSEGFSRHLINNLFKLLQLQRVWVGVLRLVTNTLLRSLKAMLSKFPE